MLYSVIVEKRDRRASESCHGGKCVGAEGRRRARAGCAAFPVPCPAVGTPEPPLPRDHRLSCSLGKGGRSLALHTQPRVSLLSPAVGRACQRGPASGPVTPSVAPQGAWQPGQPGSVRSGGDRMRAHSCRDPTESWSIGPTHGSRVGVRQQRLHVAGRGCTDRWPPRVKWKLSSETVRCSPNPVVFYKDFIHSFLRDAGRGRSRLPVGRRMQESIPGPQDRDLS